MTDDLVDRLTNWINQNWAAKTSAQPLPTPQPQLPFPTPLPPPKVEPLPTPKTFTDRIITIMREQGYQVFVGEDVMNIVYIEGAEVKGGVPNKNRPNAFDDIRMLIRVQLDGSTKLLGMWDATTLPGRYWTQNRMNARGAFQIRLGQQSCWTMGSYHNQPALVQTYEIEGTRDNNEDYHRDGPTYKGLFGVHHHGGYDYPHDDLGKSSAGCQVGRAIAGHLEFMKILKTDKRYQDNHNFVFTSTVMPVEWI